MEKPTITFESLWQAARGFIQSARAQAHRAINSAMLSAYWELGRLIVEEELSKIFPDRPPINLDLRNQLDLKHEVFHIFFDIDQVMQIPNVSNGCNGGRTWERQDETEPGIFGIFDDDEKRLMVLITYNSDLGDAWEWMDNPCYPEMFSGQAYRMGINFIIYAMSH